MLPTICVTCCSYFTLFKDYFYFMSISVFCLNVCAWCPWRPGGSIWPSGISYRRLWADMWGPCVSLQFLLLLDLRGSQHHHGHLYLQHLRSWGKNRVSKPNMATGIPGHAGLQSKSLCQNNNNKKEKKEMKKMVLTTTTSVGNFWLFSDNFYAHYFKKAIWGLCKM